MNMWDRADMLQSIIRDMEDQANIVGVEPWNYFREYGNLLDELAEIKILICEAEHNE